MTEITDMPQLASILFGTDRDEAFARLLDGPPVQPAKYFDGSDVWLVTRYAASWRQLSPRAGNVTCRGRCGQLGDTSLGASRCAGQMLDHPARSPLAATPAARDVAHVRGHGMRHLADDDRDRALPRLR